MEKILALPSSSKNAVAIDDSRLREMAPEIEAQFVKSKPAMAELVKLWGMLELFQEEAKRVYCHVSINPPSKRGGRPSTPWDLKSLFAKYLPRVEERTAYRLFVCGGFIAEKFEIEFLPEALQRKIALPALATSTPKQLEKIDKRLPKKQKELFEFAEGGSQKSWLDQFAESKSSGGWRGKKGRRGQLSQAQMEKLLRESWSALFGSLGVQVKEQTFRFLNDAELDALLEILPAAETAIRQWRNKPTTERDAISRAALAAAVKGHK
jgi:hypothetical protein